MTSEMKALRAAVVNRQRDANEMLPSAVQTDLRHAVRRTEIRVYTEVLDLIDTSVTCDNEDD